MAGDFDRRINLRAFMEITAPEVRPVTANLLSDALADGALTSRSADTRLAGLWTDDETRAARLAWLDGTPGLDLG